MHYYTKSEEAVAEDILSYLYQDDTPINATGQLGLARVQADIPKLFGMALEKIVSARLDVGRVQEYMQRENTMIWLTEGIVRIAAQDICSGEKVVDLLLSEHANILVTTGLIEAIAGNFSSVCLRLLLEHQGQEIQITSQVVEAAARNESSGLEVMKLLLDRRGEDVKVTGEVVKAAEGNESSGEQMMSLLLADQRVKFTDEAIEGIVKAAAGNESSGVEVMKLLLDRRGEEVKVTGWVVEAAALNESSGVEVMKLLLDRRGEEVKVTGWVVRAAARTKSSGEQMMSLLLADQRVKFTDEAIEGIVEAAARNESSGEQMMKLLRGRFPSLR
ncbi:hypothetical protein COL154_013711 [Colletotrichum chrysophilum]|nr:hypothetical protein COL154_013711 [Colletotrichum chrysophilum]